MSRLTRAALAATLIALVSACAQYENKRGVLANVATPTGTWIAEFSGGRGWIAPDDLEDRLVDHSVSDARDPRTEAP